MVSFLSACKKDDESTPIVLPPGTAVQYSTSKFYELSEEFYDVDLNKYDMGKMAFVQISNITPASNLASNQIVSYTLPKDKNTQDGVFTIKVNLSRQALNLEAFVLPGKITEPNLTTTLTVELLRKYTARALNDYREDTIIAIESAISSFILEQNAKYPQITKLSLDAAYKFYKNGLSANYEFLKLLSDYNINFSYDSTGFVAAAPFPFGIKNNSPVLDLANSTPTSKNVLGIEKTEVFIRGQAIDIDGDFLIYSWKLDAAPWPVNIETEFRWTPDYDGYKETPYKVSLLVTDGGAVKVLNWNVYISNFNRKPAVTANCPKEAIENQTVRCVITAIDYDLEKVKFTLRDTGVNARATFNGQKTDDITRALTITDTTSAELIYTPNNKDALVRSAYFQIDIEDEGGAITTLPVALAIEDINSPPDMVGTYQQITPDSDHEWDFCALSNPDGGVIPYQFYVAVQDPDNATATVESGFDIMSTPRISGSLSCGGEGCVTPISCPVTLTSTPALQYFCYEWKASENKKTGLLTFTFKDDHGGTSELREIRLTAADRNEKPCIRGITSNSPISILSLSNPEMYLTVKADDYDLDVPMISVTSNQITDTSDIYPFLFDLNSGQDLIFKRKIVGNTLGAEHYRTQTADVIISGGSSLNLRMKFETPHSGVIKFFRPAGYSAAITIPKDYIVETQSGFLPNFHYKYKTSIAAVIEKDDIEVWVPVTIFDQMVPAGALNQMQAQTIKGIPVSSAGLTISNASLLNESGTVTITRSDTSGSLVLPKYIVFYSSNEATPATSTVRYFNYSKIYFSAGQASANVNVSQFKNHINQIYAATNSQTENVNFTPYLDYTVTSAVSTPQNILSLSSALADPTLQASYVNLYNYTNYPLYPMNGQADRSIKFTAEDSYKLPAGTIVLDQNGDQYQFSTALTLYGDKQIQRLGSALNPLTNSLTLSAATTVFKAPNGSKYALENNISFAANSSTTAALIKRINHTNPLVDINNNPVGNYAFSFSDSNFRPEFIFPVGALNLTINEGENINDYLMEVNDNAANPGLPKDPYDRHSFSISQMGALVPNGQIAFCREKGDNLSAINSPACTTCTTQITDDYWDSARCYARFFPNSAHNSAASDIDQSYTYVVTADDNSSLVLGQSHSYSQVLTLKVKEINDAPIFTDSTWAPLASSAVAPYTCGGASCGDFVEKNSLDFTVYASDPDRNVLNKTLYFSLGSQVYDIATSQWIPKPAGIGVTTDGAVSVDVYGGQWGSRYRGRVTWTPNDQEAKTLAGSDGFVIQVKVTDTAAAPDTPLAAFAYYKVTVKNINNPPSLTSAITMTLTTDQYFKNTTSIVVSDADVTSIGAPINFSTSLSLCQSDSVFSCSAPLDGWPDEIKTYDPLYIRNSAVPQCRTGAALNTQMALPYLTRGASRINGSTKSIEYPYQFEWCPQRGQLGTYYAYLQLSDTGDMDRNGVMQTRQQLVSSLVLNVQAPIFFTSPKKDDFNVVTNAPAQAFVGKQFLYQTLVKNTKKSNVRFQLLTYPTGMTLDNGSTIKNDTNAAIGVGLKWTPTAAQLTTGTPTGNPVSWHTVSLKVFDTTNNVETDTVTFKIKVKSPTSPVQVAPVLTKSPNLAAVSVDEKFHNNFSVIATDANPTDTLFYSWFVDNVKKFDEGPNFDYFPSLNDFGQHTVRVDVYDGYYTSSASWVVNVRNTVPNIVNSVAPDFDLASYNLSKLGKTITSVIWKTETKVETVSGADSYNSILFSGSYSKNNSHADFIYNLKLKNGVLNPALAAGASGNPLLAESLPWDSGDDTNRISYKQGTGTTFTIVLSPLTNRNASFTSGLTKAVCIPQTLGISTSGFNPAHICSSSSDANQLYKNENSYGNLVTGVFSNSGVKYDLVLSSDFRNIYWTDTGSTMQFYDTSSITDCGFANCGNGMRFFGIGVSNKNYRIYVTARDVANSINKLLVFDATPLLSGSSPNLIATLNIFDGVNIDNKASDIIVVNDTVSGVPIDKVYIMLPGTGGMAVLPDSNVVPIDTDITFIGNTGGMGKSPTDKPAKGRRLVYNTGSKLIYGVVKDSNQVFSIDVANNNLQVQPITVFGGLDTIMTFSNDKNTYGVSRSLGQIFRIQ